MWKLATPTALLTAGFLASCGTPCMTMANCMPSYVASPPAGTAATLNFWLDARRSPQAINQQLHAGEGPAFENRRYIGLVSAVGVPPPGKDLKRLPPVTIPSGERLFLRIVGRGGDETNDTYSWFECENTFSFIPEPRHTYDVQQRYSTRRCAAVVTDTETGQVPESFELAPQPLEAAP